MREALQAIAGDGRRAGEIVLRAHRLVRKQPAQAEQVDPAQVAAEVLAFTRTRLRHAGVKTVLEADETAPKVVGDAIQLYQALLNLVVNAIEAMESQPQDLERVLRVTVARAGKDAVLQVADTGPGADDELIARMFQTFHTTKARGTGLGLSLIHIPEPTRPY